jgi:predicted dehydrogenase
VAAAASGGAAQHDADRALQVLSTQPVRIGVIGTARVVPYGLIQAAQGVPDAEVAGVASRTLAKAEAFAAAHGVPRSFGSYEALLGDADIDAVYIALPTALHGEWARRALEAGKHVLCEKPLAPNAAVAEALVAEAGKRRLVLVEGLHLRYLHRLQRQRELVASGDFGRLVHIDTCFRVPKVPMADGDFRLSFELGGGAGLDLGCYAVSCLRYVSGEEPQVLSATCRRAAPQVDRWMKTKCRLPSGATATVEFGFRGWYSKRVTIDAACERGFVKWEEGGLVYRKNAQVVHEPIADNWTYQAQLQAFVDAIRGRPSAAAPGADAIANARVIDAMYSQCGLAPRPSAGPS